MKKEIEPFSRGGYVRIIKTGSYNGVEYKEGEIWKIINDDGFMHIDIQKGRKKTTVCIDPNIKEYGQEAEWVGMKEPKAPEVNNSYQIF